MKAFHQYRSMQGLAATRTRLGLSQEVFAMELGISRSLLSKAENKTRSLPTPALIKLSALELRLTVEADNSYSGNANQLSIASQQALHATLNYPYKDYVAEADRLQHQLKQMIKTHVQVQKSLQQLSLMISDAASGNNRFLPSFLEMQQYKMIRKLNRCGPSTQANMRNKITLLLAAADLHTVHEKIMTAGMARDPNVQKK